jgi:LysM repeat protein
MKKLFTLLFVLPLFVFAQKTTTHTVVAKESFSSIGRMYNINPRVLANMNKLDYEKGLTIGQVLTVPAIKGKVTAAKPAVVKEAVIVKEKAAAVSATNKTPIKHTVAPKETLYGLSKLYKTTIPNIQKWNNLTTDVLADGLELIVGYSGDLPTEEVVLKPIEEPKPIVKKEIPPVPVKKVEVAVEAPKEVVKVKKEVIVPKKVVEVPNVEVEPTSSKDFSNGVFKSAFASTGEQQDGVAGVFKSTSGWEDGKYYCLHNGATTGTILKITNKVNGKFIYAKVLDTMPDLKPNASLVVRVSSAAADILGAGTNNFNCGISY